MQENRKKSLFKNNYEYKRSSDKADDIRDLVLLYGIYTVLIGLIVLVIEAVFF